MPADGIKHWPVLPFWKAVDRLSNSLQPDTTAHVIHDAYIAQFVASASGIAEPVVTSAMIEAGLDWRDPHTAWDVARDPEFSSSVSQAQPTIKERIERLADVFISAARDLSSRLGDSVIPTFGILTHVRLLGDVHIRGAVALLYFDDAPKLIYKPRSLAVDILFAEVLEYLKSKVETVAIPRHPWSLDRGDFGFQEFVQYSSASHGEERIKFYEQFGVLIGLAYALNFSDLHCENVLATADGPVVLDAECILNFGPNMELNSSSVSDLLFNTHPSVFDSELLPDWRETFQTAGPKDVSALGNYNHSDRLPTVRSVEIDAGSPRYVYRTTTELCSFPNQPAEEAGIFPAAHYREDIVRGFETIYDVLCRPEVQAQIILLTNNATGARTRLVLADTAKYEVHLQSARPLTDVPNANLTPLQMFLWRGEQESLKYGVVPLYERLLCDGSLILENGDSFETSETLVESLSARLAGLTASDKEAQKIALNHSLDLGFYNPSNGLPPALALPHIDNLASRIDTLVSWTTECILGEESHPWVISSDELKPNFFTLRAAPPGLYSGVAGISFALGIAGLEHEGARSANERIQTSFRDSMTSYGSLLSESSSNANTSLTGIGYLGPLLGIASLAKLSGDIETTQWVSEFGRRLTDYYSPSSTTADFIDGLSGTTIGFFRLYELTREKAFLALADRSVARLVDFLPNLISTNSANVGLAHGLSGISLAFQAASVRGRGSVYTETAQLCLNLEDELITSQQADKRGASWSWCWGATGQLTARLGSNYQSNRLEELRSSVLGSSSSLRGICHGSVGVALLLRSADYISSFGIDDAKHMDSAVQQMLGELTSRAAAPSFAPDPGLYTGSAGLLVYLASLRDSASFSLHDLRYEPGAF